MEGKRWGRKIQKKRNGAREIKIDRKRKQRRMRKRDGTREKNKDVNLNRDKSLEERMDWKVKHQGNGRRRAGTREEGIKEQWNTRNATERTGRKICHGVEINNSKTPGGDDSVSLVVFRRKA